MRLSQLGAVALVATVAATTARAQTLQPTVRKIADIGAEWISGIIETRNGRFIVYAAGDSIFIRDRRSGATQSTFGRATDAIVNSLGSSASGDRIVFVSRDDQDKGPFVWTLAIDTLNGRPLGPARRVGVMPAADPSLSPDGSRIAFLERNPAAGGIAGGAVRLFTIPSNGGDARLVADMTGRGPMRVARWSADGNHIYFQIYPQAPALGAGPSLWRVRASGGRPDSLMRVNMFTDVSPDGRYLAMFPSNTSWQQTTRPLYSVTSTSGASLGTFALPYNARPYSWSRTGAPRILAVVGSYPSAVKTVSLADGSESTVSSAYQFARKGRYSPNGNTFAYQARVGDKYQFILVDTRTRRERVLATNTEPDAYYTWSPDGASIAFFGASEGRWLNVVHVPTGRERRLVNLAPGRNFAWRSDSKGLLFVVPPENGGISPTEIGFMTVDGQRSKAGSMPASMVPGDFISFLDDSTYIYRHAEAGVRRLSVGSIVTGEQRVIYTGPVSRASSPIQRSPDGKWVAFSAGVPNQGGEQVVIASLDGKESRPIGPPQACGAGPMAFHPDGKHLLAWAYPGCEGEAYREVLFLFSLNGDAPRQLTDNSGGHGEWSYSLSHDGRMVMYEQGVGKGTRSIFEFDFGTSLSNRAGNPGTRRP